MSYHFCSRLTATLNLCMIYFKITWALAILLEHMHRKFEINRTKIKDGCQSGTKVVSHDSKTDLPLTKHKDTNQENKIVVSHNNLIGFLHNQSNFIIYTRNIDLPSSPEIELSLTHRLQWLHLCSFKTILMSN